MADPRPGGHARHYDGYNALDQAHAWDATTRRVVLSRLDPSRERRFFSDDEAVTASALLDRLLAQDDEPKLPVLELIDARLAANETDGWRYEQLPEDRDAWRTATPARPATRGRPWSTAFATTAALAWRRAPSPRSTSRCGTSPPGCSTCRCAGCSGCNAMRCRSTAAAGSRR